MSHSVRRETFPPSGSLWTCSLPGHLVQVLNPLNHRVTRLSKLLQAVQSDRLSISQQIICRTAGERSASGLDMKGRQAQPHYKAIHRSLVDRLQQSILHGPTMSKHAAHDAQLFRTTVGCL